MFHQLPPLNLTPEDIENDPNATINNLDPVIDGDFVAKANETFWDFSDSGDEGTDGGTISYYFSYTDDGVLYYALFVGTPGMYGDGATPFVEDDFVTTTDSETPSEIIPSSAWQFHEKGWQGAVINTGSTTETGDVFKGALYDGVDSIMYYYPITRWTGTGDSLDIANHLWDIRYSIELPGE
jgi:hypothetical protein